MNELLSESFIENENVGNSSQLLKSISSSSLSVVTELVAVCSSNLIWSAKISCSFVSSYTSHHSCLQFQEPHRTRHLHKRMPMLEIGALQRITIPMLPKNLCIPNCLAWRLIWKWNRFGTSLTNWALKWSSPKLVEECSQHFKSEYMEWIHWKIICSSWILFLSMINVIVMRSIPQTGSWLEKLTQLHLQGNE